MTDDVDPDRETTYSVRLSEDKGRRRLDRALADALPDLSRSRVKALILGGAVSDASGFVLADPSKKVPGGVALEVLAPEPEAVVPEPENIPLDVLHEDDDVIVIDKPAGLVVHPAAGNPTGTLVNALLHRCGDGLSGIGAAARPGIVHRLDKDTSGVMVAAKSDLAHRGLSEQFRDHSLRRSYRALVWGVPEPREGEIESRIGRDPRNRKAMAVVPVGGKHALTRYRVIRTIGLSASLVECRLATGRTHQIRVHMTHIGHPIIGDPLYGGRRRRSKRLSNDQIVGLKDWNRQALHANFIGFTHPKSGGVLRFESALPSDINNLIDLLQ